MRRNAFRLSRRHRGLLYGVTILLYGSGVVWEWLHHYGQRVGEFGPETNPAEPWALKAHGAAAMAILVVLGTLLPLHVKRAWQAGQNRVTGTILLTINVLLILTGYGLYYAGGEGLRPVLSLLHWWIGVGLPALLVWHIVIGHRQRRQLHRSRQLSDLPA